MNDFLKNLAKVITDRDYKHLDRIEVTVYNAETNEMETIESQYDERDGRYFVITRNGIRFVGKTTADLYKVVKQHNQYHGK